MQHGLKGKLAGVVLKAKMLRVESARAREKERVLDRDRVTSEADL